MGNFTDIKKDLLIREQGVLCDKKEKLQKIISDKFPLLFYISGQSNNYRKKFGVELVQKDILWLIEKGFDINQIGLNEGFKTTLLHSSSENIEKISALIEKTEYSNRNETVITEETRKEYFELLIKVLLDYGASTNLVDEQGKTPSHPLVEKRR